MVTRLMTCSTMVTTWSGMCRFHESALSEEVLTVVRAIGTGDTEEDTDAVKAKELLMAREKEGDAGRVMPQLELSLQSRHQSKQHQASHRLQTPRRLLRQRQPSGNEGAGAEVTSQTLQEKGRRLRSQPHQQMRQDPKMARDGIAGDGEKKKEMGLLNRCRLFRQAAFRLFTMSWEMPDDLSALIVGAGVWQSLMYEPCRDGVVALLKQSYLPRLRTSHGAGASENVQIVSALGSGRH